MASKKTITQTFVIIGGAIVGLVLLWEATSLKVDMDMPIAIDWAKIGSAIVSKVADVVRQFFAPR